MASFLSTDKIEHLMWGGMGLGVTLAVVQKMFGATASKQGGRVAKVFVEIQRKSFHMIGGCIIAMSYHYGIKFGFMTPAFGMQEVAAHKGNLPLEGGGGVLSIAFVSWLLDAARLSIPAVQEWYLSSFRGLIRQKEMNKGAGVAFFIPGALAAFMSGPPNLAILGVLFLSVGDAGASIGTAAGKMRVFASERMVEGSIACWTLCAIMGWYAGLPAQMAMICSAVVTLGEVLAEIIGLDDNLVIPIMAVIGARIAMAPQFVSMFVMMAVGLGVGVLLGTVVGATTAKGQKISQQAMKQNN